MFPKRKPKLDAIVPGNFMTARDGTAYQVDHVTTDGNKQLHSMTLERVTPKRDKSMSPRQWRNKRKAERRLERERKARLQAAAERKDGDLTATVEHHAGDAELLDFARL